MKKHIFYLTTLGILFVNSLGLAAPAKPITFDDFIRIKRVSDPQVSPDGSLIAFVVTIMDKEANKGNSDIWIVPVKGGEMRQLTSGPKADFNPRWSPDGKKIAFISARTGTPQVYIISLAGGEASPLTSLSTGASGVIWSPKGTHLAFTSSVYPDCADDDCNKKRAEEEEKNPVKARLYDRLLYRHWNTWWDGTRSHLFIVPDEGGKPVDVTPGDYDTPPIALGGSQDYTFSPDGNEICFVRNTDPELALGLGTNNDLFLTSIKGGESKPLTTSRGNDNLPVYSPNGQYVAYLAMARPGFEADKSSLMLHDRKTGKLINLTESLDSSIQEFLWSADSSTVFFSAEEKGRTVLFKMPLKTAKSEKILEGHFANSFSLSPDSKVMVFLSQAMDHPADVYSYDLQTGKLAQITDVNKEILSLLQMNPAEEFWFEGAGKDKVHGFLLNPPSFDPAKKYPLVMLIHGGPQGAWYDNFHYRWNAQMFAAAGYAVAMINFHGSTGYGQAFTDSISGDWGGKPYQDIMLGLHYLLSQHNYIDKSRLAAAGASYGGYMIDWIEGQTDAFKCLISHSGVYDLRSEWGSTEELWFPEWEYRGTPWTSPEQYQKWSPSSYVQNFKTPCLVIHSQNDFRVPLSQGLQFFTALQRMKVPSKFLYFPDEDHFVQKPQNAQLWWKTMLDWLAYYFK